MLHLRLITPSDRTDDVIRLIEKTVGTTHLCVMQGAARNPAGDVVTCDVAREAGDELLQELREFGLDRSGSIAVENIDLSLSSRADRAEDDAPGEAADAVLWEHLENATHEESTLSVTYVAFITLATMIAACGVVLDNAVLIVGAMAVGPEFGPLAGICTATVQREPRLAARSLVVAPDDGLRILSRSEHGVDLSVDGRPAGALEPGTELQARFVSDAAVLAQQPGTSFYRRLREKFGRLSR